jgi:hypothetical protein
VSSLIWAGLLAVRIAVTAVQYSPIRHDLPVGIAIALGGTLFLASITTQKFIVFQRSRSISSGPAIG